MTRFQFSKINPLDLDVGANLFGHLLLRLKGIRHSFESLSQIQECIDLVEDLSRSFNENDGQPYAAGLNFLRYLDQRFDKGLAPLTLSTPGGRDLSEAELMRALAFKQADLLAVAYAEYCLEEVWEYMWDLTTVLEEIDGREYERGNEGIAANARSAAAASHREHRQMKSQVQEYYCANSSRFKSKDSAAEEIAGNVVPMSFRTVRGWLQGL